jgi:hypothetical protein
VGEAPASGRAGRHSDCANSAGFSLSTLYFSTLSGFEALQNGYVR